MNIRAILLIVFLAVSVADCKKTARPEPPAIPLAEIYKSEFIEGKVTADTKKISRTEFLFQDPSQIDQYGAQDVSGFKIVNNRLSGRSTSDFPLIQITRKTGLDDPDLLHSIEIRLQTSGAGNIGVSYESDEKVDLKEIAKDAVSMPWRRTAPLLVGDEIRTYTLTNSRPIASTAIRHILIRPVDKANVEFAIESVRLVFRKEFLAGVPSGRSWQGLSEIYHDTVVSRSPEKIRFPVTLSARPWLDVSFGTLENQPVQFLISVLQENKKDEKYLLRRTLTTGQRWESARVDLTPYARQKVTLCFSLSAEEEGTIGLWGSPIVRTSNGLEAKSGPPGVILIWADTLRSDHLDAYGYSRSTAPNLKRMADEGALFRHHVVHGTWTKVSTPSLMTSLYPSSHGIKEFTDRLPASAETLAEVFQKAGYATINFSSILFTGQFTNLHQGFDQVHEDGSLPDQRSSKTTRVYLDRLLPWLETHKDVPFFVFLHISDPHDPYRPYAPYDTLWSDPSRAEEHERQAKEVKKTITDPLLKAFGMPNREEVQKAGFDPEKYRQQEIDWYDGSIRGMDAEVGRLLERLKEMNLDHRTLVAFVGDHGEEFYDHGRSFHGQTVYEELAHTPLILRFPGVIRPGQVVEQTAQNIDVMPTVLELSGLRVPEGIQGQSLRSLIVKSAARTNHAEAMSTAPDPAFVEKASIVDVGGPPPRDTAALAVILDGWKLIHNTVRKGETPEYELYNLREDPREQTNVFTYHPDVAARLTKTLESWRKNVSRRRLKPDAESTKGMSREELERLRSLGYIQ